MKIYHGSSVEVPKPQLDKGKPNNDYGRGFYCTEDIEMAREWAFENLRFLDSEEVAWGEYHPRYVSRDSEARAQWRNVVKKASGTANDLFAIDIIRRGLRNGNPVIQ